MPFKKATEPGKSHYPFGDDEYRSYQKGHLAEPSLFQKIREAADRDIATILEDVLPVVFNQSHPRNLPFQKLDGLVSRDAFLTRVGHALMHFNLIERELPNDGIPIPRDLYYEHVKKSAIILVKSAFLSGSTWSDVQELNARLILLKAFASVLHLHGQVSDSVSILAQILTLYHLKEDLQDPNGGITKPPREAWPSIKRLEIVFGVFHHLKRGILPARLHLQEERGMNKKNFSNLFTDLEIAKLIPSGYLPKSVLFRERLDTNPRQIYYTIDPDAPKPGSADKWPGYLNSDVAAKSKTLSYFMQGNLNLNYYSDRRSSKRHTNLDQLRSGRRLQDARYNIKLIKERLGGIYWHLLSELNLEDLSTQEDLDYFLRGLSGLGISLDF